MAVDPLYSIYATSLARTLDVVAWVFVMAAPAGAEGMRDGDNQLAYKNYLERHLGIFWELPRSIQGTICFLRSGRCNGMIK